MMKKAPDMMIDFTNTLREKWKSDGSFCVCL